MTNHGTLNFKLSRIPFPLDGVFKQPDYRIADTVLQFTSAEYALVADAPLQQAVSQLPMIYRYLDRLWRLCSDAPQMNGSKIGLIEVIFRIECSSVMFQSDCAAVSCLLARDQPLSRHLSFCRFLSQKMAAVVSGG